MAEIQDMAVSLCLAVLAGGIFYMISPNGSTRRVFQIVISAFFACICFQTATSGGFDLQLSLQESQYRMDSYSARLQEELQGEYEEAIRQQVEQIVQQYLAAKQISAKEIHVFTDTLEDTSIVINKIKIVLKTADPVAMWRLELQLEEDLGIDAEVTY